MGFKRNEKRNALLNVAVAALVLVGTLHGFVFAAELTADENATTVVDRSEGQPVEVAADPNRRHYVYCDKFEQGWFKEDATIDGLGSVVWDRENAMLRLEGAPRGRRRVSLTYQFVSPFTMKDQLTEVEGRIFGSLADRIELSFSKDGKQFGHVVRAFGREDGNLFQLTTEGNYRLRGSSFFVRVTADLSSDARVELTSFRTVCRVKPEACPVARLVAEGDGRVVYRDSFASEKFRNYAEIENGKPLEWRRGEFRVRGRRDEAVRVVARQKFAFDGTLRSVAIRIRNAAQCDAVNEFGLSLDGSTLLVKKSTAADGTTELRIDDAQQLAGARQVYLHIVLASKAGSTDAANVLSGIEVEGLTAVQ